MKHGLNREMKNGMNKGGRNLNKGFEDKTTRGNVRMRNREALGGKHGVAEEKNVYVHRAVKVLPVHALAAPSQFSLNFLREIQKRKRLDGSVERNDRIEETMSGNEADGSRLVERRNSHRLSQLLRQLANRLSQKRLSVSQIGAKTQENHVTETLEGCSIKYEIGAFKSKPNGAA